MSVDLLWGGGVCVARSRWLEWGLNVNAVHVSVTCMHAL